MTKAMFVLAVLGLAGCATIAANEKPAGQPSSSDVNPISGNRGGSGTK